MSRLGDAIKDRNKAGYLGLIPCIIPGFPDVITSRDVTAYLDDSPSITGMEFTLPAGASFSETANQVIVDANQQAVHGNPNLEIEPWLESHTPGFLMFYREATEKFGFEALLERYCRYCEAVMLEWDPPDLKPYWQACRDRDMELVPIVAPLSTDAEFEQAISMIAPDGLFYFECSDQAGGARSRTDVVTEKVKQIKTRRPDTLVIASMGIRTPDDVREMAAIPGINAVAVGTGFFEATRNGVRAVRAYLAELEPALTLHR